ncbi:MAG: IS66 family transposase [Clostridiales Family XIII bacterium]|jgi:transposase|nr:IS66 family transposase [Clostridiales Family XIII bacterium]
METQAAEAKRVDFTAMSRGELEEFAAEKATAVVALEAQVKSYEELLRKANAFRFGASSERHVSSGQLSIFNEAEAEQSCDAPEPKRADVVPPPKKGKRKGHRQDLVKSLPKETAEYVLTDEDRICPKCGGELSEMKTVVRTEVVFTPATYKAVDHRTKVYSCRRCDKEGTEGTVVVAPSPKGMFRNSLASPSLVAGVILGKYGLALPLYRQAQEMGRVGFPVGRNVLANWVIKAAEDYLSEVLRHMQKSLLSCRVLHADETTVEVLKEDGRAATATSYMWAYRTGACEGRQVVLFRYAPGRGAEYPKAFLEGYSGYIHTDGYSAYRVLLKTTGAGPPTDIVFVGCWAHARRKFTDIVKGLKKSETIAGTATEKALAFIGRLFEIEKAAKEFAPEKRHAYRQKHAAPVVDAYFAWCKEIQPKCAGDSLLKAVNYSLNQEDDLRAYLLDGRLEISNNLAENAIRPFCVGRRNWLFADTPEGADASAACYSVVETAKANGVDPFEYLKHIFTVFKDADTAALDMEDFMPWSLALPDCCRRKGEPEALAS